MALHSPESLAAIDRTQPLPLAPLLDEKQTDLAIQQPSTDSTDEHKTLYVSFDAGPETSLASGSDAVELVLPDANKTSPARATVSNASDPAELVQIQALELAANRAEIARQAREQAELQRAMRLRDTLLEDLRKELKAAKDDRKALTAQLSEAQSNLELMTKKVAQQQTQIASLEAQISERMGMTEFASEAPRTRPTGRSGELLDLERPAKLVPLDEDAPPFVLNRKAMTVGRTRDNDVCVPSALVSRDHARLLVSKEGVVMFDVGSINGCFVNDELTRRQTLRDGDIVRFADRSYRFSV